MSTTNTYKNIHSRLFDFGNDCLNEARQLEKVSRKLARTRNHLRYNLTCYNSRVTPAGLSLKSNIRGPRASNIIQKAERALVNERIRQHNFTIDILETEKQQLKDRLQAKLPSNEYQEVVRFSQNASQVENDRVKSRHIEKFRKLKERKHGKQCVSGQDFVDNNQPDDISGSKCKWVVNLSSRQLSEHETSVLNKGLNYGVSPRAVPVEEFIVATEVAWENLDATSKEELRSKVTSMLKTTAPPVSNVNAKERQAINDLKKRSKHPYSTC